MLAFFVLAGLFGRDPWKGEDAIHIAATWNILAHSDWLSPDLAGRVFSEPPLYYWSAAITGHVFGWAIPLHDAIRLASGIWVALSLTGIYYAGRELYGQDRAAASPLLLASCFGLAVNAHEAQPMLIALASYCATLAAMSACARKPNLSGVYYGLALAACLLGCGIAPVLPLLAAMPLSIAATTPKPRDWRPLWIGGIIFVVLSLPWPLALASREPARFDQWITAEWLQLLSGRGLLEGIGGYLANLPSLAFPAVFIVGWTLWSNRQHLGDRSILVPVIMLILTLVMLAFSFRPKELPTLLLLPPLALLATPGALSLRRGAAAAFDWFATMTFSFFAILAWIGWSALTLGWPERLARRAVALRPGFFGHLEWLPVTVAVAGTLWWLWLSVTTHRSPYRPLVHWAMGLTTFWLLASLLWLPWFDYGRSYRSVAEAVAHHLPTRQDCLAELNLSDTQRASLAYFVGIEPLAYQADLDCRWLLVQRPGAMEPPAGWKKAWEGSRPGDRKERFHLFHR